MPQVASAGFGIETGLGFSQARQLMSLTGLENGRKAVDPCTLVIFGASGDLTARKLIPALFHLNRSGQMPARWRIIGVARREKDDAAWREELRAGILAHANSPVVKDAEWDAFAANLFYHQGDVTDKAAYAALGDRLREPGNEALATNLVFYLATSPTLFGEVVDQLHAARLLRRKGDDDLLWQRVVVEKPFGQDLQSARELNNRLIHRARERQIFRIDHYLGKETVQNILMFRFSNAIFEQLWHRESVEHVQITVSEDIGVGGRGGYFEEAGTLRDMVQNHLLQILSLVAMEPPVLLEAEAIRSEKVKLLQSIRPLPPGDVARGQYFAGTVNGDRRIGYRQEERVDAESSVETFVALKLFIDNWRWSDVPFYLRTGKNLPLRASEVRVQFRPTPHVLFATQADLQPNALTLRLQPDEGIFLRFNGKVPGNSMEIRPVRMHFDYDAEFGAYTPAAYERLLLEAMAGDTTLFIRRDEVETAWGIVDRIREDWAGQPLANSEIYAAGTWGPEVAEELLARSGHQWHNPQPAS